MEGWNGVGGGRKGTFVYLWLIHVDVWQKPTQYCKAIIFQLKITKKKKKSSLCKRNWPRCLTYLHSGHEQHKLVSGNIFLLPLTAI